MQLAELEPKTLRYSNIVAIVPKNFSDGVRAMWEAYMRNAGVPVSKIKYFYITEGIHEMKGPKYAKKARAVMDKAPEFTARLSRLNADFLIVMESAALEFITGKYHSLANCRSSIFKVLRPDSSVIPVYVLDDIRKTKSVTHYPWVYAHDARKLSRWLFSEQRKAPRFSCTIHDSVASVRRWVDDANPADNFLLSTDVETTGTGTNARITSLSVSRLAKTGHIYTDVFPIVSPVHNGGNYWQSESDEIEVRRLVSTVLGNETPVIMQNGGYDMSYFARERISVREYYFDTAGIFHAIWPEAPKRIDFIASICVDYYRYWKDEGKEKATDDDKSAVRLPQSADGLHNYWRYNGLDTYYTLLCSLYLLQYLNIPQLDWGRYNFRGTMRATLGPAFAMSTRGVRCNTRIKSAWEAENQAASFQALTDLRTMVDDPEYNPNSPPQTASLLYDVLKASGIKRKGRSTDEKVLRMVQTQNWLLRKVISQIWAVKKPANNASKYGTGLSLWNNRWHFKMNPLGTETERYSSSASNYWIGTQFQNPPEAARVMVEADPGYILWERDYSASDAWFTAYTGEIMAMIDLLNDTRDTHCVHAAQFFQRAYDEIYAGYKAGEPWVVESITGVRQISKRIGYGANYLMAAFTLLQNMSIEAVIAAAKQLGFANADNWSMAELTNMCQKFIDYYFQHMYPELRPWIAEEARKGKQNGNRVQCAFGRTRIFFGDMNDGATQRELAAFFGQGGTAGNINLALENIFYGYTRDGKTYGRIDSNDCMVLAQIHDSVFGQVRETHIALLDEIERAMSNECTLHGRTFTVPSALKVGYGWGRRMMSFDTKVNTLDEVRQHDAIWWANWNQGRNAA